jgi:hypothetical protein
MKNPQNGLQFTEGRLQISGSSQARTAATVGQQHHYKGEWQVKASRKLLILVSRCAKPALAAEVLRKG